MYIFGSKLAQNNENLALIGEIDMTAKGNVSLRIGRLINGGSRWAQTEYVVLTRDEARNLLLELEAIIELIDRDAASAEERVFIVLPDEARELIEGSPNAA
jgi:hypothetical protein